MDNYDDIINLSRPKSMYPKQSISSRSSQFAPFAALTGYDDLVSETARLTSSKRYITDEVKSLLNDKLTYLYKTKTNTKVTITYFKKDFLKPGGEYLTITNSIKKIDTYKKCIILIDNTIILFNNIIDISSDIFNNLYE